MSSAKDSAYKSHALNPLIKEDHLARSLSARQVNLICIAGCIGSGLFLSTGKALASSGPASLLICYAIIAVIVYFTMLSLGEMSTYTPIAGSFCSFATRYVDEAFGFALTWNYWFNDAVSVASDLTALQLIMKYWTDWHPWAISLIFWAVLVGLNLVSVRVYGEFEYWLAILKVVTIIIFIILGIVVNCGANTSNQYIGFHYWYIGDAPFVDGFKGFAKVFVSAAFAYGGTESIAITAGETKNPSRVMPKVVKMVFWRILFFYLLSVLIIGINVPYNYKGLETKNSATSPFTIVFQMAGSKAAGSFINAVIFTSLISAGNHAMYAGTRLLYSLGAQGYAPKVFTTLSKNKVPYVALAATSAVSGLCFGASFIGAGTLWSWLQNLVGVSNQLAWWSIGLTSFRFRKAMDLQGKTHLLKFKSWANPWGNYVVVIGTTVIILIQGWSSFAPWNVSNFFSNYIELGVMPVMYLGWKLIKRTKYVKLEDMDLETDKYIETEDEKLENEELSNLKGWPKWRREILSFIV
ncbi:hypothetical protein BABINDRAFT_170897 [Babjeviella inositovora NRRL Y-12698]|uniref:Amino acid permease/ SLC12A domain-containing protein n=1 Tax=Babjeviella inositovora NRRL Y-12698 TaxID=984486 RepID=A0A1E3QUV5_9ASCO|nr:uncharacterized protein BABINDRAFT_170897 [Babjeviella inositovora NRRL Y-12698]ODQ81354.1 hypothetical protein BABINDRAFT_170897 [Babjeviella inositovora NRRL Y-12698]